MKDNAIQLSVLDIERKYHTDYTEYSYGDDKPIVWGDANDLPKLYFNCYAKSSTLKSVIDSTVKYILGDDIIVGEGAKSWDETVNRTEMSMRELIERLSFNLLLYNGFAIQVIYNKLGVPVELYPLDFGRCRINEKGTKVYYAKKWSKYQTKYEEYDRYNPSRINPERPTQIYYYKSVTLSNIYPLPPYNGAINDILTEIECSQYSLNTVAGGFSARYILNFPEVGNLTDEQKRGIEDAIKTKFCGTDNEVNFMLYWKDGNGDDFNIKIDKIESDDTSERYIAIKDSARQNIFIAMRTTPMLCGLPNATNGFSTNEYRDSFKLFQKSVIEPYQDTILSALRKIIGCEKEDLMITPFNISFDE